MEACATGEVLRIDLRNGGGAMLVDAIDWHQEYPVQTAMGIRMIRPSDRPWRLNTGQKLRYAVCKIGNSKRRSTITLFYHRLIMQPPKGLVVDHINGDCLDNRRANLRVCTNAENSRNARINGGTSQFKGVYYDKRCGRWKAQIGINNRRIGLGSFPTELDAARAYNAAARELFGDFARLNPEPSHA